MFSKCMGVLLLAISLVVGSASSGGVGDALEKETSSAKKLAAANSLVYLANHAYAPLADSEVPGEAGGASLLERRSEDAITGFKVKTYTLGDELVVAFAGTEISDSAIAEWEKYLTTQVRYASLLGLAAPLMLYSLSINEPPQLPPDVKTDGELAIGSRPAQFRQAVEFVRAARKENSGKPVVLTGHSLGGGLAMYSARMEGDYAVTFNAAFLNSRLRKDQAARPAAKIFAFEAVASGGLFKRDVVSAASRLWFRNDPNVQIIDVEVERKDFILHGLQHFMKSDRRVVNWVKTQSLPVKLPGSAQPSLEKGTAAFRLVPGEKGMTNIIYVAAREGYVSSLYIDATKAFGTVTTPKGTPLNVRIKPDAMQKSVAKLWQGDEVSLLEEVTGQEVTRVDKKSRMWFRIKTLVLRSGRVDSEGLTDDPNQAADVQNNVAATELLRSYERASRDAAAFTQPVFNDGANTGASLAPVLLTERAAD